MVSIVEIDRSERSQCIYDGSVCFGSHQCNCTNQRSILLQTPGVQSHCRPSTLCHYQQLSLSESVQVVHGPNWCNLTIGLVASPTLLWVNKPVLHTLNSTHNIGDGQHCCLIRFLNPTNIVVVHCQHTNSSIEDIVRIVCCPQVEAFLFPYQVIVFRLIENF